MSKEATKESKEAAVLYPCSPTSWLWLPPFFRVALGYITMTLFAVSFLSIPLCSLLLFPWTWRVAPTGCAVFSALTFMSMIWPAVEWPKFRKVGQLWYEVLQFSCNLSPEQCAAQIDAGDKNQYIIGMHPHGIVPFHAILWSSYCDQYLSDKKTGRELYGFGAAADVVMYIPFLRNVMAWLSAGPADYKTLKDGLVHGKSKPVNAGLRQPRHLYLLPGGIAEVFTSCPGKHVIVFKKRLGLCRLALETGAHLCPTYVFGGTDFFQNLSSDDGVFAKMSRKMRMGVTIFWGHLGLPLPFLPRVSLCIADPIVVEKWTGEGPVPEELVQALHDKYLTAIQNTFDKYKAAAGYPDARLEIS